MPLRTKATLQFALQDKIYAYALEGVIDVVNTLYTHYCWLEQAEQHQGSEFYGDQEFAMEDFLIVPRAEIGTPNLIELLGWFEPIKETMVYIALSLPAAGSLLKNTSGAYKNWVETRQLRARDGHERAMQEQALIKAKLENEKLAEEVAQIKRERGQIESPAEKAERLHQLGKVSPEALEYKRSDQTRIDDKLQNWQVFERIVIQMNVIPQPS